MKTHFLDALSDEASARAALSEALPNWVDPWLLKDADDDVVAYFTVYRSAEGGVSIQADLSGRHYSEDRTVLTVLKTLKDGLAES